MKYFSYLKSSTVIILAATAAQLAGASVACAQSTADPEEANSAQLGDIIVTAQKREQRLSDVGITITAATGDQLQSSGVSEIAKLSAIVPGFAAATTGFGNPIYSLRGINFNALQASAAPAVTTYLDEAPLPYPVMTGGLLLDVERVEVLKGPQGTLFGQNSTGGSINVIAAKPTSSPHAGLKTEVNHFGEVMLEGYVSGPLSDTLRVRLAASTTQFGAWQKGYFLNNNKNGDQNKGAARLLLDWTPTDRMKVSLSVNGFYNHGEVQQGQPGVITPVFPPNAAPGLIGYPIPTNNRDADIEPGFNTHADSYTFQPTLRFDYDLTDDLVFTSISNYVKTRSRIPLNFEATAIPIEQGLTSGDLETFTQEVRLTGNIPDAHIGYVVGANYQDDKIGDSFIVKFPMFSGIPVGAAFDARYKSTNKALAVFANVDFEILPDLTLTGGARYTDSKQTMTGCTYDLGNGIYTAIASGTANLLRGLAGLPPTDAYVAGGCQTINDLGPSPDYLPIIADEVQKEDNIAWRVGLNYKPTPDSLIYGTVARGFKSGTFPVSSTLFQSTIKPVKQEEITSYEAGIKLSVFDRRLQFNLAGFYYDYKNKQFVTYTPIPNVAVFATVVNIPKSKAKGIDFDFTARPIDGLTFRGALLYLDTKVGTYSGFDYIGNPVNYNGSRFNQAPKFSGNLSAEYRAPVGEDLEGFVAGGVEFSGKTYADLGEFESFKIVSYAIFDARIGVESSKGWRFSLFGRNLSDKFYWTNVTSGGEDAVRFAGLPRTFGISAGFDF